MCGIFGIFAPHGLRGDLAALRQGSDIARYRGPDGDGTVWFDTRPSACLDRLNWAAERWAAKDAPTLLLCHRRLAIIDLSDQGRQPMATADGALWITYNGELYNFIELREELKRLGARFDTESDTEVILKAYETWGPDATTRFVGMWAFALLDLRGRRLVLSRDRFGIKPLHYHRDGTRLSFGSEIKQLLAQPSVPRWVNHRAVYDYLQFEAADTGSETFLADIHKVRPGHNLIVSLDTGEYCERSYYQPLSAAPLENISAADAAAQLRMLLKESVRMHLRADVPVGTCLSGGLDSSSIAMLMREVALESGLDIERHSFSAHFDIPEANELEYTEASIAAAEVVPHFTEPTADELLSDLRKLVWHQDEPFGSTSIYAQWAVFRLVQQNNIKVVLDGQGADEMLGGYATTMPHFLLERAVRGPLWRGLWESWRWSRLQGRPWRTQVANPAVKNFLSVLSGRQMPAAPGEESWVTGELVSAHAAASQYVANMTDRPFGDDGHFSNILYQFFFSNNLPALLRHEDRNSMAFSVESRVPFLDHRLVDFVFALPSAIKVRNGYTKRVLRDAMAGTLPDKIRMRARKMGFATPERLWQNGPLRQLILDAVASPRLEPFVSRDAALRHFERVTSTQTVSFAPWRWLNLSLWLEEFALA